MGNWLGCFPSKRFREGHGSRSRRSSRSLRKMPAEDGLLHRHALAMTMQQHQLSQRFDGSMSRRIGSTSSRKHTPSTSFRKQVPLLLDNLETKKIILVHGEGFGAWCWYKIIPFLEEAGLHSVTLDLTASGIDNTDINSIRTLADYTKPLIDYLHNLPEDEKVILVGHSCGGASVSYALECCPKKIAKAIFLTGTMVLDGQRPFDVFVEELASAEVFLQESQLLMYANGKDKPPTGLMFGKEQLKGLYFNQSSCKVLGMMESVQSPNSVESKIKRRKNFLWSLKPEWIAGLLQIMSEYVDANMRSAQGFKDAVYQGVAKKMKEKFGVDVTSEQCKNQVRHQRNIWSHIQELKKKSGVSWDDNKKMILMGHEEYLSHIQAFPKDAAYLNISISNYMELEKVCGEGHATGQWAKSANSQTPLGTEEINLEEDNTPIFVELDVDTMQDFENLEMEKKKRVMPPSLKSSVSRKKTKISDVDQNLREYIVMMADSVSQVANAIQNTSRAAEEKRMFSELITELLNIPGFCKEEISLIYDNLSKNPTMIQSFLAKPIDLKANWMRQELDK